jgi:hypothetical protein
VHITKALSVDLEGAFVIVQMYGGYVDILGMIHNLQCIADITTHLSI